MFAKFNTKQTTYANIKRDKDE